MISSRLEGRVILSSEIQSRFYKDDVDCMSLKDRLVMWKGHSHKGGALESRISKKARWGDGGDGEQGWGRD